MTIDFQDFEGSQYFKHNSAYRILGTLLHGNYLIIYQFTLSIRYIVSICLHGMFIFDWFILIVFDMMDADHNKWNKSKIKIDIYAMTAVFDWLWCTATLGNNIDQEMWVWCTPNV